MANARENRLLRRHSWSERRNHSMVVLVWSHSYSTGVLGARNFAPRDTPASGAQARLLAPAPVLADRWQRAFELFVEFHLVAGNHFVGFVRHADDGLQFVKHLIGHTLFSRGGGVRRNAVVTIVGDAHRHVE